MIQAEQPEDRGVDIVNVAGALDGAQTDLVGGADILPCFRSASGHEHREAPRIVVPSVAFLIERSASEFASPHDQGIVQHAARFQIRNQAGDRLIRFAAARRVVAFNIDVGVPTAARAGVQLHKTHAPLHQPPGQKTVLPEGLSFRAVQAVQLLGGLGLLGQIHRFGPGRLHLVSQLVGADPRFQLGVARIFRSEALVQFLQKIQLAALLLIGGPGGRLQMQDRCIALPELRALISGFEEARAPVFRPAYRFFAIQQYYEGGEIPVCAAQSVSNPGAHGRASGQDGAGIHLAHRADVIQAVRPAGADNGHLVDVLGHVGIPVGHPHAALPVLLEGALRAEQGIVAGAHGGDGLAERSRHGLAVHFGQLRLRVEDVDVAGAAFHE